jgi:hypothetical protein
VPKYLRAVIGWPLWLCVPTDRFSDLLKISFFSITFTLFALFSTGLVFVGGASQFTDWAEAIAHGGHLPATSGYASRDVGFPILLWLSGYPQIHSFIGMTLIQAAMAGLMPLIIYLAIRPISAAAAYYTALTFLFSMFPFTYMKWMHHDQTYAFFTMLSVGLLVAYITSRRPWLLYLCTLAFVVTNVTRPAGNLLFPTFFVLALAFVRVPWRHYAISLALGVLLLGGYSLYRHWLFQVPIGQPLPTYLGEQVFYDLYLNSKEYGIVLSPTLGPSLREVTDRTYQAFLPNPRHSSLLREFKEPPSFNEQYYYPFTAAQMRTQLYRLPNWEYYAFVCDAVDDDPLLLSASLEIARHYPFYVLQYTSRNVWVLLYAPGGKHARLNVFPFFHDPPWFPLDQRGFAELPNVPADAPAVKELHFNDLDTMPTPVHKVVDAYRTWWPAIFSWTSNVTFYLIALPFAAVCLKYVALIPGLRRLRKSTDWLDIALPGATAPAFIAAFVIFIEGVVITGMFAEPDIRYYYIMLGLRFMVAGFGAGIIFNLVGHTIRQFGTLHEAARASLAMLPHPTSRQKMFVAAAICVYAAAGASRWVFHITRHAW